MKNILVPIGSNKTAVNTLQYAVDFALETKAKIYVIHVFGVSKAASSMKNIDVVLEQDSEQELKEILAKVDRKGVELISKSIKGNVIDSIERVAKQLNIGLIISSAKSISVDDEIYLGKIAGGLIKKTNIPVLVIPKKYQFKKVSKIMMAIKSGILISPVVLDPLKIVLKRFDASLDLIRVITPDAKVKDSELNKELKGLATSFRSTENATVFQGVLEHIHEFSPDMLCVIRRKRGFFSRLWENEVVYKKDFESRLPLLVLKGAF
jgi:nucleotide-binding universal stress UspA family protein